MNTQLSLFMWFGIFEIIRTGRHGFSLSFHNIGLDDPWSLALVRNLDYEDADNMFPCCS
jgi:hypothetical protein